MLLEEEDYALLTAICDRRPTTMNSCCEFAVWLVGKEWVGVGRWPRRVWYAKRAGMSPICFIKGGFTFYSTLLAADKIITPPLIY